MTYEQLKSENPRIVYYILDWRDSHLEEYFEMYGMVKLADLTDEQMKSLYNHVVEYDKKHCFK